MEAAAGILWRPNTPGMLSSVAAVPCNIAFLGLQGIFLLHVLLHVYRIAGNFRGAKYSWFSWLEV